MLRKLSALPTPVVDFLLGCVLGVILSAVCYFALIHGESHLHTTPAKTAPKKP